MNVYQLRAQVLFLMQGVFHSSKIDFAISLDLLRKMPYNVPAVKNLANWFTARCILHKLFLM